MADQRELALVMGRLEESRQASLRKRKMCMAWIAALAVPAVLWLWISDHLIALCVLLVISLGFAGWYESRLKDQVRGKFKDEVLPILLSTIDLSLCYAREDCIGQSEFDAAELFASPDRYSGQDLVQGKVGDTALRFSLVHAEEQHERETTDAHGNKETETYYTTLFQGLFLIVDFNKDFRGRTWVTPGQVGFLGKLSEKHVAMEDAEFNKLFTVRSGDQVEARYLLTPSLMERMKGLRYRLGPFRAGFANGSLYLAFNMDFNAFEPQMEESLADFRQGTRILSNLLSITNVVDDLALNVRIWTKGVEMEKVA